MLTLGEDRALVTVDLLDRPARPFGSLIGGGTGADQSLDIAWTKPAVDLDLELAQAWAITTDRGPQRLVDGHLETRVVGSAEQQVLTVLVHSNELQVLHGLLLGRPTTTDSAIFTALAGAGHAAADRFGIYSVAPRLACCRGDDYVAAYISSERRNACDLTPG